MAVLPLFSLRDIEDTEYEPKYLKFILIKIN